MLQIISLLVENKPGALMRITGLLSARGYNIESLTVARTLDPELSRMTIVVDVDATLRQQVIKQMNKLVNVLQAVDLTESPAVRREMVLVRVRTVQETRTAVLKEAEIFGARVVDSSTEGFALEATGDSEKLDEFIDVMRSYGDIEVTRSGAIAVSLEAKKLRLAPPIALPEPPPEARAADTSAGPEPAERPDGDGVVEVHLTPEELVQDVAVRFSALNQDLATAVEIWRELPPEGRRLLVEQASYVLALLPFMEAE